MKNLIKKVKKLIRFRPHKRYSPIGILILSNKEEIKKLKEETGDERYNLVPIYDDLTFNLYPMEHPSAILRRKRKLIKKNIGKYKFKILKGFWKSGVDFFDSQEYQDILRKKAEKKALKNG